MNAALPARASSRGLFLAALSLAAACAREHAGEDQAPRVVSEHATAFGLEHEQDGTTVIVASKQACKDAEIEVAATAERTVARVVTAPGVLLEDPACAAVLRAPFAGQLVALEREWPQVGGTVAANQPLFALAPRVAPLTPAERADLEARSADAEAARAAALAELDAARTALERAKALNAQDKAASDQAVEAAAAAVAAHTARVRGNEQAAAIYRKLLGSPLGALEPLPLSIANGGTVVSVAARVGESVEAGAELLRACDFTRQLARVTLPVSAAATEFARVVVRTPDGAQAAATLVGPAPESSGLGTTLLLRVDVKTLPWRPGQWIQAELEVAGAPIRARTVPARALVRFEGQTWVYVEIEPGRFSRRKIAVERFIDDGAIALLSGGGSDPGSIVVRGAASLLSREQLGSNNGGGED